jgi:pimeloyl-ACP methyl ester carboxylesterase
MSIEGGTSKTFLRSRPVIARQVEPLKKDAVVLVHGLAANRLVMASLTRSLKKVLGVAINWGYRSLWSPLERHGRELAGLLRKLEKGGAGRIHLVTHSMGGIIGRLALAEHLPSNFGRFVMIAPPNRGSHVAAQLAPYLGRICPPLIQLTDQATSYVCSLPHPQVPALGIIAADTDFLVREPNTRLGCEHDHIVLPGLHSSLLWRQETAEQVRHFLEYGHFRRQPCTAGACSALAQSSASS